MAEEQQGLAVFFLRAWMWFVPIAMLVVAVIFGLVAALDGQWALLAVMIFVAGIAIGMLFLHWWILYRFGQPGGER